MLTGNKFKTYKSAYTPTKVKSPFNSFNDNPYQFKYDMPMPDYSKAPVDPYANTNVPENNPYLNIDNSVARIEATGVDAPERKQNGLMNGLMTVLDVISRPQYAMTNALSDLTDDKHQSFGEVLKGMGQGITGERKSNTTDVFDNLGWKDDPNKKWYQGADLARNILGFVGDVAIDPTTYLTLGGSTVAKMAGKGAVKASLGELTAKMGNETLEDLTSRIATALGKSTEEVASKIASHGEQGDLVARLSAHLGDLNNVAKTNTERISSVLEYGMKGINKDVIQASIDDLGLVGAGAKATQTALEKSRNMSLGATLGSVLSSSKSPFNMKEVLDTSFDVGVDAIKRLDDVFKGKVVYSVEDKQNILKQVFDLQNVGPGTQFTDKEVGVMETLFNVFGRGADGNLGAKAYREASKDIIGKMTTPSGKSKTLDNLLNVLGQHADEGLKIAKIEKGVEFSNGLRAVYDDVAKRTVLQYHNIFTGTVKPLVDFGDLSKSPVMVKAGEMLAGTKTLRHVVDAVSYVLNPQHIRTALKNSPLGDAMVRHVVEPVTQALHKETGLPHKALDWAVGLFKESPEFLNNQKLRRAITYYLQRNNDEYSRATWEHLSGAVSTATPETLEKMNASKVFESLDDLKITPEELAIIEKQATKIATFNETIMSFDYNRGIVYGKGKPVEMRYDDNNIPVSVQRTNADGSLPELDEKALAKENKNAITPESYQSYVHQSYTNDPEEIFNAYVREAGSQSPGKASMSNKAMKSKMYKSYAMQKVMAPELNGVDDVISSMALRAHESLRVDLNKQLYNSLLEASRTVPGMNQLIGTKKMSDIMQRVTTGEDGLELWAHPDVVHQLNRVRDHLTTNPGQVKLLQYYDKFTNALKTLQTSMNPSFLARNFIGEPMMNWLAGVDERLYAETVQIMNDIKAPEKLIEIGDSIFDGAGNTLYKELKGNKPIMNVIPDPTHSMGIDPMIKNKESLKASQVQSMGLKTYDVMGKKYTGHDLMNIFREKGLGWSGISKGNLVENSTDMIKSALNEGNTLEKVMNTARGAGDYVETMTRFTHFLDRIKKGMSIDDAVMDVRAYHVDYRDLTDVERNVFRRIMPYYTYMRKNLPIQMNMLLKAHNKVGVIAHLVDNSHRQIQDDNEGRPIIQDDYLKEGMAIPIDVDKETGNVRYLNWNLPMGDLARLKYHMGDLFETNVLDMLHPFIRAGIELPSNQNLRFGTEIEQYPGQKAPLLPVATDSPQVIPKVADYMLQQTGIVQSLRTALGTAQAQMTGNIDPNKPPNEMAYVGLNSVLPLRSQVSAQDSQAYAYRDELQAYIKKLKDSGVDVPDYTPDMKKKNRVFYTPTGR